MRELKYQEKKLLRKNKFFEPWKNESTQKESLVMRRYHLTRREDYARYNQIVGKITKMVHLIKTLKPNDKFRIKLTEQLCERLYSLGVVNRRNSLEICNKVTVSAFCRRRFPVVLTVGKWSENIREATQLIEQGHFNCGNNNVTDPNTLLTRAMQDNIEWSDTSKVKRKIQAFKNQVDDYDLYA